MIGKPKASIETAAEAAQRETAGIEVRAVNARTVADNLEKEIAIGRLARSRHPLDLVFIRAGGEAEQVGDTAIDIAQGIGIEEFMFEFE